MRNLILITTCLLAACDDGMTTGQAEDKVRAMLREPSSAEFTSEVRHPPTGDKGAIVCGFVNAKNGFGGMTGPQRFLVGKDAMIDNDTSEMGKTVFNGVYENLCGTIPLGSGQ